MFYSIAFWWLLPAFGVFLYWGGGYRVRLVDAGNRVYLVVYKVHGLIVVFGVEP